MSVPDSELTVPGGLLVAVEGVDGAGKSLQVQTILDYARSRRLACLVTKEPTNGPWGRKIRESAKTGRLSAEEELQAFLEDRKEHVAQVIRPNLEAGRIVVTDRYYFSTVAYQGARGYDPAELMRRNEAFAVEPDLLLILDLPPEESLKRIRASRAGADAFETVESLRRCRQIFLGIKKPYAHVVDAARPVAEVQDEVKCLVLMAGAGKVLDSLKGTGSAQDQLRALRVLAAFGGKPVPGLNELEQRLPFLR